jgi:hypothetical protein
MYPGVKGRGDSPGENRQVLTKVSPRGYTEHPPGKDRWGKWAEGSDFDENSLAS